jgi:hypothetical protein
MSAIIATICTIRQLPQAFALGASITQHASKERNTSFVIGLADKLEHLPGGFSSDYTIVPVSDFITSDELDKLSAQYTPTEFAGACKPAFLQDVFRRFPDTDSVVYVDPGIEFFSELSPIWERLNKATILLTPYITGALPNIGNTGQTWPDEKFFQNLGLYTADFLALRRSAETDKMLNWWQDRVQERAFVNFCEGLCTDQRWLMHVPIFFQDVAIVKEPNWHVALWNLPQRDLTDEDGQWQLKGSKAPLLFLNTKGLYNPDEGFFPHQNRLVVKNRPDLMRLLDTYRKTVSQYEDPTLKGVLPAYGQQPEPVVLRGWRFTTVQAMRAVTHFVNKVPLPVLR